MRHTTLRAKADTGAAVALVTLSLLAGCDALEQDKFLSAGGISPDPTARMEGTVFYVGPRPRCEYDGPRPARVMGRVFLTLFEYTNPPPPEGTATTSANVVAIDGDKFFRLSDCLGDGEEPNPSERITRSAPFQWPKLTLYPEARDYQIRGFYDHDEDMVPFFSVTRIPTAGDVVGAALNDIQDAAKGFLKVTLPAFDQAKNGFVYPGVTVALGNVVRTERPAFRFDANRKLNAETPFPAILVGAGGLNGSAMLRNARFDTCANPAEGLDGASCGLTLERLTPEEERPLFDVGVELATNDPASYAFYAEPVDIRTVLTGEPDVLAPDGKADPHPFMSGLNLPWYTPMLIMTRTGSSADPARSAQAAAIEARARIPRVLMIGSILFDDTTRVPAKSSYTRAPVGVLPVAAVELIAGRNDCRVPYFGRTTDMQLTSNRVAHCGELPSGYYAPSVLGGIAGGQVTDPTDPATSESGRVITGGRYSGQSWSIPNELGDPAQVDGDVIPGQGLVDGAFVVFDPDPNIPPTAACPAAFGRCEPGAAPVIGDPTSPGGWPGYDTLSCLPNDCCEAVAHLCAVPRCEITQRADGSFLSDSPTTLVGTAPNGAEVPNCIPFELPVQCCPPQG